MKSRTRESGREMHDSRTLVAPEIHVDLLIEILARLPAKSVIRFKCISKFWSSLFSSRYFCNRFLMFPLPQPRLYLCLLDRYDNSKSLLLSSATTPTTFPSSLELDPDLTIGEMDGCAIQVHCGFICFIVKLVARIYNPSTKQLVILPAIESDIIAKKDRYESYAISYFVGHEPVKDRYKLVCTITGMSDDMQETRSENWVFVLEAEGLWKRVAKDFGPHFPGYLELTMNGVLYYLACTDSHTCVLVSFDMRSEEFNMIKLPPKVGDVLTSLEERAVPIEYSGKVAVFDMTCLKETGTVDIWILEDWSKKEWSTKSLVVKPCQMHLVIGNHFMPKCTTLNGKVILAPVNLISPFYFLCYDLQINDLQKVEIKGIPDSWFNELDTRKYFDLRFMDTSENIKHLET